MVCGSLYTTESAFCAIFGLPPKLVYRNEPCLVERGFQNVPVLVPVLVPKHTLHRLTLTRCFIATVEIKIAKVNEV